MPELWTDGRTAGPGRMDEQSEKAPLCSSLFSRDDEEEEEEEAELKSLNRARIFYTLKDAADSLSSSLF